MWSIIMSVAMSEWHESQLVLSTMWFNPVLAVEGLTVQEISDIYLTFQIIQYPVPYIMTNLSVDVHKSNLSKMYYWPISDFHNY